MASRKKTQNPSDDAPKATEEEKVVVSDDVQPEEPEMTDVDAPDTEAKVEDTPSKDDSDSIELAEPDSPDTVEQPVEDAPAEAPTEQDTTEQPAPAEPAAPVEPKRRSVFLPLVLGGALAAGGGYFAATELAGTPDLAVRLEAQEKALVDVRAAIPEMPEIPDTTAIETAAKANTDAIAGLTTRLDDLASQISALGDRLTAAEKAPVEGAVSDAAMKAYEDELTRLQDAMRQQREEVETMLSEANQVRATAEAQSAQSQARAALTAILAALDSGAGYADPLADLQATGQQVPEPLTANAGGIPTLASLRTDFPAAARAALAATRGSGNDSVGGFFKSQLGIRSLEPKEGDDPDAVLSRAEAAVADGDIATALAEITALPAEAQAELSQWIGAAETRLATVEAAKGLMAELNSN